MMNNRRVSRLLLYLVLMMAVGCSDEMSSTDGELTVQGELLTVRFEEPVLLTRGGQTTGALAVGTEFKVYAYNQHTTVEETTAPLAEGTYKVQTPDVGETSNKIVAVSGGELKLYAGVYNLCFVSLNSGSRLLSVSPGSSRIDGLANGDDFIYAAMENVGVRSVVAGQATFTITLDTPFIRMCSSMRVSAKAKEGDHPVQPTSLVVKSIAVNGLSGTRNFILWNNALKPATSNGYTESYIFHGIGDSYTNVFSNNTTSVGVTTARTSSAYPVLPTDGSVPLTFNVTLTVGYPASGGGTNTKDFSYKITTTKALLAGNLYEFAFTLTFFDDYVPADLQLDILPFVNVPTLDTGIVGG